MAKGDRMDRDPDMDETEEETITRADEVRGIGDEEDEDFIEEEDDVEDLDEDEEEGIR